MSVQLIASVLASGESKHAEEAMTVSAWWYGGAAMSAFLILLLVVTRLNLDR